MNLERNTWTPPLIYDGSDPGWPIRKLKSFGYLVGVLLKGDGSVFISQSKHFTGTCWKVRYEYRIELRVRSWEFAVVFRRACSKVLGRNLVKIRGPCKDRCYIVTYYCANFVRWWKHQGFSNLRRIAESLPEEYLKGRFDSESNVHDYAVYLCGASDHKEVLELDQQLCGRLGMRTGRILPHGKVGSVSMIGGRMIISRLQKLRFSVNARDFLHVIHGISVPERNLKLRRMIKGRGWTPWNGEIRSLALTLFGAGMSQKQVALKLYDIYGRRIPSTTIHFWTRRGTRSWAEFAKKAYGNDGFGHEVQSKH